MSLEGTGLRGENSMKLILRRISFTDEGVFGLLFDEQQNQIAVTLTHAYDRKPKVPDGQYTCVRGMHRLSHMDHDFETFEITGVEGHTNILFHPGNRQEDSEGCELLGTQIEGEMITESCKAFDKFMGITSGLDSFTLVVT